LVLQVALSLPAPGDCRASFPFEVMALQNYFEILGGALSASGEEIERAYLSRSAMRRPDRFGWLFP